VHDEPHGTPLIEALARFGDGLPANVLPFSVNEVTQIGLEAIAAAFAYGAAAVRWLLRPKPRHDVTGLTRTLVLAEPILAGLGFGSARVATIETDDPDALAEALQTIETRKGTPHPATFLPVGGKRDLMRLALRELQRAAPAPVDVIALPAGGAAPRAGLPARSISTSRDVRSASPACRHARPAHLAIIRSGRCYASRKMPAYNAGYARPRVRRKLSRCGRSSTSAPRPPAPACSKRKSRFIASAATSCSASRARSSASPPSSRANTGCSRIPRSAST